MTKMSESEILEQLLYRFDKIDERFDKMESKTDKRFDKLEYMIEEQNIVLYNIRGTLKKHSDQLVGLNSNIKKTHDQTVRLSLIQADLSSEIDKIKNPEAEKTDENINNI